MATATVEQRLTAIIVDRLKVAHEEVTPEKSFIDDLGADSLDVTELFMLVEEEFNIQIGDDESDTIRTVGDVIAYLQKKIA